MSTSYGPYPATLTHRGQPLTATQRGDCAQALNLSIVRVDNLVEGRYDVMLCDSDARQLERNCMLTRRQDDFQLQAEF